MVIINPDEVRSSSSSSDVKGDKVVGRRFLSVSSVGDSEESESIVLILIGDLQIEESEISDN